MYKTKSNLDCHKPYLECIYLQLAMNFKYQVTYTIIADIISARDSDLSSQLTPAISAWFNYASFSVEVTQYNTPSVINNLAGELLAGMFQLIN